MEMKIFQTKQEMSKAAAQKAAAILMSTIEKKGKAVFVAATGTSQFEFLEHLTSVPSIDWSRTTMFHLDEYIGLPDSRKAQAVKNCFEGEISPYHPASILRKHTNAFIFLDKDAAKFLKERSYGARRSYHS